MISKALNESDRLSSNTKGARERLRPPAGCRVHAGIIEGREELIRHNVDGICLNATGMRKLGEEIVLTQRGGNGHSSAGIESRLFTGVVPLGQGSFRELTIREGRFALVDAESGAITGTSDTPYFEVCNMVLASDRDDEKKLAAITS